MGRYTITDDGYMQIDNDGSILHKSRQHNDLFEFINKDFDIDSRLKNFLYAAISVKSLRPKSGFNESEYFDMQSALTLLHPFCDRAYLSRSILLYLNDLLIQECLNRGSTEPYIIEKSHYDMLCYALIPREDSLSIIASCYQDYTRKISSEEKWYPGDRPFEDLYKAKSEISEFLYWVFDADAVPFNALLPQQRLFIYKRFHPHMASIDASKISYLCGNPEQPYPDTFCKEVSLLDSSDAYAQLPTIERSAIQEAVDSAKDHSLGQAIYMIYSIDSLYALLSLECYRMYEKKIIVRKCLNCQRYFILEKQVTRYCTRPLADDPQSTCQESRTRIVRQKQKDDPLQYLYIKAYRTHYARIKAGRMTKMEFSAWSHEAKRKQAEVAQNPALLEDYAAWLKI